MNTFLKSVGRFGRYFVFPSSLYFLCLSGAIFAFFPFSYDRRFAG